MPGSTMKVQLTVPYGAAGGTPISATAGGVRFKAYVPHGLRPGQVFFVNVPVGNKGAGELDIKDSAAASAMFDLLPGITIGPNKYIKDVRSCGEMCDCTRWCCPYVRYNAGGDQEIIYKHKCACLPCCCDFAAVKGNDEIGTLTPAGCCDQDLCYLLCPCCYVGEVMKAKYVDNSGTTQFTIRSEVKCCQYICLACSVFCAPCVRCCRFCCTDKQYAQYEQNIYGPDLKDTKPLAKITYIERMILPCFPNEQVRISIEPAPGTNLNADQLAHLATYPILTTGLNDWEFGMIAFGPCGVGWNLPGPTGIESIDLANKIQGQWMSKDEALELKQQLMGMK